eukprot:83316-Pelagomonas_calceolata.AAC.5
MEHGSGGVIQNHGTLQLHVSDACLCEHAIVGCLVTSTKAIIPCADCNFQRSRLEQPAERGAAERDPGGAQPAREGCPAAARCLAGD